MKNQDRRGATETVKRFDRAEEMRKAAVGCVLENAQRLAASSDAAPDVARAALLLCAGPIRQAEEALTHALAWSYYNSRESWKRARLEAAREMNPTKFSNTALVAVVEARTPKPPAATPPQNAD